MNRHQVLTGAANAGDHCYAVGSVEGVHFTVGLMMMQIKTAVDALISGIPPFKVSHY